MADMDSGILLSPKQLQEIAEQLSRHAKTIQTSIDEVDHEIKTLGPDKFQGARADNLRDRYTRLRDRFYSFKPMIDAFAANLVDVAAGMSAIDQKRGQQ